MHRAYLQDLLNIVCPKVVFLQEIWLPYHDKVLMNAYFPDFHFNIATPDMIQNNEDKLLNCGPVWHGCALG